jgi:hypothetical protein
MERISTSLWKAMKGSKGPSDVRQTGLGYWLRKTRRREGEPLRYGPGLRRIYILKHKHQERCYVNIASNALLSFWGSTWNDFK